MELQTYINNHPDFISDFKKQGFKVNTFKDLKSLVRYLFCLNNLIANIFPNPPENM